MACGIAQHGAEHAEVIRTLGKRVVADVIEIGRRLTEAKALCRRGEWYAWLEQEFAWEEITARRFIGVYELAGKAGNLPDLSVPVSGLYLLARPSTPEPIRTEILDRAESGEHFTHAQVKGMIAKAIAEARPGGGDREPAESRGSILSRQTAAATAPSRACGSTSEFLRLLKAPARLAS
jgi:Protein of unknown function (DUF3102)